MMIDVSGAKWNLSKEEKILVNWLENNDFEGKLIKQMLSKTVFEVTKNNVTDRIELPNGNAKINMNDFVKQYQKSFEMLEKLSKTK